MCNSQCRHGFRRRSRNLPWARIVPQVALACAVSLTQQAGAEQVAEPQRAGEAADGGSTQHSPGRQDSGAAGETVELSPGSIVIEAEPLPVGPSVEELMQRFRANLREDKYPLQPVYKVFATGVVEVTTRYGKFCLAPLPTYLSTSLTFSTSLASRCTLF
jgi:hypothetical protein